MKRITSMKDPLIQAARSTTSSINSSQILLQDWAACTWALKAGLTLDSVLVCESDDKSKPIIAELKAHEQRFHWTTAGMMQKNETNQIRITRCCLV